MRTNCILMVGAFMAAALLPMVAASPVNTTPSAMDWAQAISAQPGNLVTADWYYVSPTPGYGTHDEARTPASFPTHGANHGILSSGDPACWDGTGPSSNSCSRGNGGTHNGAVDSIVHRTKFNVPSSHNHLHIQYQFCSEEFPEYVGSQYNDGYFLELDSHTWSYGPGGSVTAPDNFAQDASGQPVTINTASMSAAEAVGSNYDGCTCKLTSYYPVTPGVHELYTSITDASDSILDSSALTDFFKTTYKSVTPDTTCNVVEVPLEFDAEFKTDCQKTVFTVTTPEPVGAATYTWDFGDGSMASTTTDTVSHQYASPGTYTVTVQMFDAGTGDDYEGTMDVEIFKCELAADATFGLSYDEYYGYVKQKVPIYGGAVGTSNPYGCLWDGPTDIKAVTSCTTYLIHDEAADFEIEVLADDKVTGKTATDKAWVHILPTPPQKSNDEDYHPEYPVDHTDPVEAGKDTDGDGKVDSLDKCPALADVGFRDLDNDGLGDACDPDMDGDGVDDLLDNCRSVQNPLLLDTDGDGMGDACDVDDDGDGKPDFSNGDVAAQLDNCRLVANGDQANLDGDALGDACDPDRDNDGVSNQEDAFPDDPTATTDANQDRIDDARQDLSATETDLAAQGKAGDVGVRADGTTPRWVFGLAAFGLAALLVVGAGFVLTRRKS